jgi:lysyl-tRNA synthetase, class II
MEPKAQNPEVTSDPIHNENELIAQRRAKLQELRKKGIAFPNDFRREHFIDTLHANYASQSTEDLLKNKIQVTIAGRIMLRRIMGKAMFMHIQDMTGRIQLYLRKEDLPEGLYENVKEWDLGDIVGVKGFVFKTKTGELSIHTESIRLLTKAIHPLPDKYHGMTDKEMCYRQRYVDLIMSEQTRKVFSMRTLMIDFIRDYLKARRFIEVETPMMQVMPGGANARPFITHHNVLDIPLYLRVAPELYLKRLVVGGFERVFEINRNFRNEGISVRHNPEFTMLEFYLAYADYHDLIRLTEDMFKQLTQALLKTTMVTYQGQALDFGKPFAQFTMKESITHFNKEIKEEDLNDLEKAKQCAMKLGLEVNDADGLGKIQTAIFEKVVEHQLIQPTFITAYPAEVSPLARRNDQDPFFTDRFELYVAGRELANGFSELNDPEDQAERFREQVVAREAGDDEAMYYDHDYIAALEYGMPPTAGEGIGIDRLAMILTDTASIRDVILFPHMKPIENK